MQSASKLDFKLSGSVISKTGIERKVAIADNLEDQNDGWRRFGALWDARTLALLSCLISVVVMILYRPFARPEVGDPTIYDYIAQAILRGQIPYRDVVDIKGPGAPYLSAVAIFVGRVFGLRDIFAIRALHVLLVGLLSAVTFQVANAYLRSRAAAAMAVLIPLLREPIAKAFIGGTQPKLTMMIFGLLTLLMIAKDRPFVAGVFSMLSCLCWQPGLLFTGTAVLIFSRYLTSWRDLKALRVVAGAVFPLALVLGYFYSKGALGDLWAWTITYNYSVFGPEAGPTLGSALSHIWVMTRRVFEREILIVLLSVLGLFLFVFARVRDKVRGRAALVSPDLFKDAIVFPPLIYFAFTLINFQGPPDLIPFFPFVGIFAGWLVVRVGRAVGPRIPFKNLAPRLRGAIVGISAVFVIFAVVVVRAGKFQLRGFTLQDQEAAMQQLTQQLQPDDKIYVHGAVEILVLLNRPNLNPYVDFDWGKDNFAVWRRGISFREFIDEMEAAAPKYVSVTRLRKFQHREELEQWVNEHYERLPLLKFDKLYVRKGS